MPTWFYDWKIAPPYAEELHGTLRGGSPRC